MLVAKKNEWSEEFENENAIKEAIVRLETELRVEQIVLANKKAERENQEFLKREKTKGTWSGWMGNLLRKSEDSKTSEEPDNLRLLLTKYEAILQQDMRSLEEEGVVQL